MAFTHPSSWLSVDSFWNMNLAQMEKTTPGITDGWKQEPPWGMRTPFLDEMRGNFAHGRSSVLQNQLKRSLRDQLNFVNCIKPILQVILRYFMWVVGSGCREFHHPPSITMGWWPSTTSPMALKLDMPSVRAVEVRARLRLAHRLIVLSLKFQPYIPWCGRAGAPVKVRRTTPATMMARASHRKGGIVSPRKRMDMRAPATKPSARKG